MKQKPTFIKISSDKEDVTLSRYVGKTHTGTLKFSTTEVNSTQEIKDLVEEYRRIGDKIYEQEPETA
jgi:hypothetical protein